MFPWSCGLIYRGPPYFCVKAIGAAVLKMSEKPAVRAVLWEGVPILSDSDAKPPAKSQDRLRKRSSGNDVGNALRAAYHDTLKEEIPPDLLSLLGKLD